jgi:predicted metal-binding membrane protein
MRTIDGVHAREGRTFFIVAALVFVASATLTFMLSRSMSSSLYALPMPGNWMLSSMWTQPCGRSWLRAALSFIAMWCAMMTAMMLPTFAPLLRLLPPMARVRMSVGYLSVWTVFGVVMYGAGIAWASLAASTMMHASAFVVIVAGIVQASAWKARRLACCRAASSTSGIAYGVHCVLCCAPLTTVLFISGAMNVWLMLMMTVIISAERLAANGEYIARAAGFFVIATGVAMLACLGFS